MDFSYTSRLHKRPDNHNVISLIWDEQGFEWVYNGVSLFTVRYASLPNLAPNPFLEKFHMLLNAAVGGHYPAYNDADPCYDSQKLVIDYVAYYQKNSN